MILSGEEAERIKVIRSDSYLDVIHPKATLLSVDTDTGAVRFKDHVNDEEREIKVPPQVLMIVPR